MKYLVSDYCATGEGRTVSIYVGHVDVRYSDYKTLPGFKAVDGKNVWNPGELKADFSVEARLKAQFEEEFGDYFSIGVDILSEEQFLEGYRDFIPSFIMEKMEDKKLFNFVWKTQFHFNYG